MTPSRRRPPVTFVVTESERAFYQWIREHDEVPAPVVRISLYNPEKIRGLRLMDKDKVVFAGLMGELMDELRIAGWKP